MIAIDLGSNSCRFLHVNCESGEKIGEFEAIVKTADNLHVSKKISIEAQERIINAIEAAKTHLDFSHEPIVAVTTEAMRQATNSHEVLYEIEKKTAVSFELIDGKKEAFYTLKAVKYRLHRLGNSSDSLVLIDIGGGSTEVIFSFKNEVISQSFKVGIVTIAQQCNTEQEVRTYLERELDEVKSFIKNSYENYEKPKLLVATAGTPTTISAYLLGMDYQSYDPDKINGYTLTCKGITKAFAELMTMDEHTRSFYVGVGRENLIAAGIIIVDVFYQILGFEAGIVIDDGLREGLARSYCESIT
ncbi:MAG: phosphatase [Campylobacterota bacterium]|nr:phosphatase [Campylobacterota bacterium]